MSTIYTHEGKSQGDRVVSTKIPREAFTQFQRYCKISGETINASLKRLILSEINSPNPVRIAAKSIFEYNRHRDNFSWKVVLDDDTIYELDHDLPASSVDQLLKSVIDAIEERRSLIQKNKTDSTSFPTKLLINRDEN